MPDWFSTRTTVAPPVASTLAASGAFGLIAALVAFDPDGLVGRLDASLAAFVRAPSSALLDRVMVGATLFGDFPLTVTTMLALVLLLFTADRPGLALHALALFTLTKFSVSLFKLGISRARPLELYPGGDVYSFPSGHAASAAVLLGVVAILYGARDDGAGARARTARVSRGAATSRLPSNGFALASASATAFAFALPVALVALSRVRLGAHWPSDVLASLLLATAMLLPFAWHVRREPPLPRRTSLIALAVPVVGWLTYLSLFGRWASRFYAPDAGG